MNTRDWIAGALTAFGCAGLMLMSVGPGVKAATGSEYAIAVSTGAALDLREPAEVAERLLPIDARSMTCSLVLRAGGIALGYRCNASGQTAALPN